MKKIIFSIILCLALVSSALASSTPSEAIAFFNKYVNGANTYSPEIVTMYSPSAKIIREIIRPDGSIVTRVTNTDRYISEMRKGQAVAKLRKYKNYYSNINATQVGIDTYKVSSLRQPSGETYKLKAYMVVQKQANGNWLIIEEMMQTKVQMLINAK